MSKSKSKNRDEVEHLRGQVRQLRKQVRYYKKLSQNMPETPTDNYIEDTSDFEICPECGKGELATFDYGRVIQTTCSLCDYDERIKVDE